MIISLDDRRQIVGVMKKIEKNRRALSYYECGHLPNTDIPLHSAFDSEKVIKEDQQRQYDILNSILKFV